MAKSITLVLLPGLDGTGKLFAPLLSELPAHIRPLVIAYPNTPMSLPNLAEYVLRALPEGRFILLAESFSGLVALSLLDRIRDRLHAVIFCAAFATPPRPLLLSAGSLIPFAGVAMRHAPAYLLRRFCLGREATAMQVASLRDALASTDPAVLSHRLAIIRQTPAFSAAEGRVPCHYLQATDDKFVPRSCADWFRRSFIHFSLRAIAGDHFLLQTRPTECANAISAIAELCDGSSASIAETTRP